MSVNHSDLNETIFGELSGYPRRPLIGLAGTIDSGKSFAASHLVENHGFEVRKLAGPLKAAMRAFGLTDEHIEGELKEAPCEILCGKTPRYAMQTIGTDWGRRIIGDDLWIRLWRHQLPDRPVVTDDVRFENEAEAVRLAGGIVVRLLQAADMADGEPAHESEALNFTPDFTVFNAKDSTFLPHIDMLAALVTR